MVPNASMLADGGRDPAPASLSEMRAWYVPATHLHTPPHSPTTHVSSFSDSGALSAQVERAIRESIESKKDMNVNELWFLAQNQLLVFQIEKYARFDTPDWAQRWNTIKWTVYPDFTVRGLIKTMYMTAEDLGLDKGKQYVAAAVCACAIEVAYAEDEDKKEALAKALQRLASTWVAYLLWPFYANHAKARESDDMDEGSDEDDCSRDRLRDSVLQRDLHDSVLQRDGGKCILTGRFDLITYYYLKLEVEFSELQVSHIFKRSVALYSNRGEAKKFDSTSATFEMLRHYCQIPDKYLNNPELIDTPQNAISLDPHFRVRFDTLDWCLKPTAVPNRYVVKNYHPRMTHMEMHKIPESLEISFKDYSDEVPVNASGKRPHNAVSVDLPDRDLLRMHAALAEIIHMSGAVRVFLSILYPPPGRSTSSSPRADGEAFMKGIVDPEVHQLSQSVETIVLGP
ncbi:hypothetical protein C8Q74DRAFT_1446868 [Fomes fomentarius]|nr:hypothetical protein C8Q74DRAFT_1446868 [Fomes fomentarius]